MFDWVPWRICTIYVQQGYTSFVKQTAFNYPLEAILSISINLFVPHFGIKESEQLIKRDFSSVILLADAEQLLIFLFCVKSPVAQRSIFQIKKSSFVSVLLIYWFPLRYQFCSLLHFCFGVHTSRLHSGCLLNIQSSSNWGFGQSTRSSREIKSILHYNIKRAPPCPSPLSTSATIEIKWTSKVSAALKG